MCVTFVYMNGEAVGCPDKYQLIILNNRDEKYDRPTSLADWEGDVLAGRDELDPNDRGGTWMGVHRDGRIGVLHTVLEPVSDLIHGAPSRGHIINGYLWSRASAVEYGDFIAENAAGFNGFHLILLDRVVNEEDGKKQYRLVNFVNRHMESVPYCLETGKIHGFGNSARDRPWRKVTAGTRKFAWVIDNLEHPDSTVGHEELIERLLAIVTNKKSRHPDEQLISQTEQPTECVEALSALFVEYPNEYRYGTRSHTILLIDGIGRAIYLERSMVDPPEDPSEAKWVDTVHKFQLKDD